MSIIVKIVLTSLVLVVIRIICVLGSIDNEIIKIRARAQTNKYLIDLLAKTKRTQIMGRYLIIPKNEEPFITRWFEPENHYVEGMQVYDMFKALYMVDGLKWEQMQVDHL